jgi:glycyl-tRNA synthetase
MPLATTEEPTLQSIILKLQQFWADQGCLIWQPYHTEVGAGTMNPATYLRVLGPEDWWVAYVEPSIRPADSRYGENPNRWGHYYQFQVILKPDPGDPQERYLQSLIALGIDPMKHDIRFVEDNWEQPALGAWGLGWEVWLDGQEITQFTYFQQAGGKSLDPVSVEITYGLERILLALESAESFVELHFNDRITYGEVLLEPEREHSRYIFELADVERLHQMFEEFEAEANNCLDAGLVYPAHDYVLKCSHTFNLLDGRGAVGVTERAAIFARMRDLARRVTDGYLMQREEAGHPWIGRWAIPASEQAAVDTGEPPEAPASLLLEIGTEELPVGDLDSALEQLHSSVPDMLKSLRLEHEEIRLMGTPRRLVVQVKALAPNQTEQVSLEKGPPLDRAYDESGKPTKAAEGFARSKGIPVEALEQREMDGGQYVVAEVRKPGRPASLVLQEALPSLIDGLRFEKSMRWNRSGVAFSRPIRWMVALHGGQVIPFEFAGMTAGRTTRLLRFMQPDRVAVANPADYLERIRESGIILDGESRRKTIEAQIAELAGEVDGSIPEDTALLDEVTNLVERPTAVRGEFDPAFLSLPRAVLISVMKKHQRYFPLERGGELMPYFITVRNGGDRHLDIVARGNQQVIGARFADAQYFVERDLERPLEAYLPRLSTMTFESSLGSMLDKVARVEVLTDRLAEVLGLDEAEREAAQRAAHLCKADLASRMVVEMTSLQGEVGRVYALRAGESEKVAEAILEHYLPRFAGDRLPESRVGLTVGLADRIDTLVGLFAAGHQPTGARDPFALRRTAIGLLQILVERMVAINLKQMLQAAATQLPIPASHETVGECLAFITGRQQALLLADGYDHDVVEAILNAQANWPLRVAGAARELQQAKSRPDWGTILQTYARCARITRGEPERYDLQADRLVEPAEEALFVALGAAESNSVSDGSVRDFLSRFEPLIEPITRFFDEVLVMAEEKELRENRLALLQRIVSLTDGVADLSVMEGF